MNKTLKLAFGAVLGAMLVMPSLAQDQFPDVPENHWVYQALLNMKNEGILVGYPDGLFRGGRPASRYELAGAINAAYQKLKGMIGGLQSQIDAIKEMGDLAAIRRELDALKSQLAAMGKYGDDIAALQRMASTFEKDLAALGVDVEAMKKDLADLATRVGNLEKNKAAVNIHGDVNFVMHAGHSTDGVPGMTVDGRLTGVTSSFGGPDGTSGTVGMDKDWQIGHEGAFEFSGTNDTGPKWHATLVVGNLIGDVAPQDGLSSDSDVMYGNQSTVMWGLGWGDNQPTSVYFQNFGVMFDTSVWGQSFSAELGRFGHQSGAMFMKRIDNTPYFENSRWDDGNWIMDGGKFGFNWGKVGLNVFLARTSDNLMPTGGTFSGSSTFGGHIFSNVWQMTAGPQTNIFSGEGDMQVDRTLGFDLNLDLGDTIDLMFHYIFLDGDTNVSGAPYNRVVVWGGEANLNLGRNIMVNAGYSQSDLMFNSDTFLDDDTAAWWASANFNVSSVNVNVGFRSIEPNFGAPGDWGRVAMLWNPVNIEGPYGDISFNFGNVNAKIGAFSYDPQTGTETFGGDTNNVLGINAELNFKMFGDWSAMLGWEHNAFDFTVAADGDADWYRVGLSHNMGDSVLMFKYEVSNIDSSLFGTEFKGGFFTTQWRRKF
jgi:hypothetical protein